MISGWPTSKRSGMQHRTQCKLKIKTPRKRCFDLPGKAKAATYGRQGLGLTPYPELAPVPGLPAHGRRQFARRPSAFALSCSFQAEVKLAFVDFQRRACIPKLVFGNILSALVFEQQGTRCRNVHTHSSDRSALPSLIKIADAPAAARAIGHISPYPR